LVEDSCGPREPCIREGVQIPVERRNFQGENGLPIVKYRDTLQSSVQKWLNRSIRRLGCGLRWAKGSTNPSVFARRRQYEQVESFSFLPGGANLPDDTLL